MSKNIRTRFAPSPTGFMHIGNLRTALYAFLYAKSAGGTFLLRIEDTDQARYVDGAEDFIYRTLDAAGIHADEGAGIGGAFGPYVQSERKEIYKKYAEQLVESGHAYRCFCDAKDHKEVVETEGFGRYPRTCRALSKEEEEAHLKAGKPYVIRQKMPTSGDTTYYDELHGNITIPNEELEDQILLKSDGMPTYNFANVIDDHLMEISHVIRGTEYITSTPKHVLLYQAFGWELPAFVHLAPVMGRNEDGSTSKLSKRHGATSFEDLTARGYLPEAITNYVALLGWSPKDSTQEIFSMEELIAAFTPSGLSKSPSVFDYAKLGWVSGEYFKKMDDAKFAEIARPFVQELPENLDAAWAKIAALLKTRVQSLDEIEGQIAFLRELPAFDAALYTNKRNKITPEIAAELLPPMIDLLEKQAEDAWDNDALFAKLEEYIAQVGIKKGTAMWALRIAIAGQSVTPGGATELLSILGKKESLERAKKSLAKLQNM